MPTLVANSAAVSQLADELSAGSERSTRASSGETVMIVYGSRFMPSPQHLVAMGLERVSDLPARAVTYTVFRRDPGRPVGPRETPA